MITYEEVLKGRKEQVEKVEKNIDAVIRKETIPEIEDGVVPVRVQNFQSVIFQDVANLYLSEGSGWALVAFIEDAGSMVVVLVAKGCFDSFRRLFGNCNAKVFQNNG